jgi:hypothetical protein
MDDITFLSEEMQAEHLTQDIISSCAPVIRNPNTKGMHSGTNV